MDLLLTTSGLLKHSVSGAALGEANKVTLYSCTVSVDGQTLPLLS